MNSDEQTAYIIHHLAEGDDPKELIYDLCQMESMNWPQAEALVMRVQEEKEAEITRKQMPLLFALALVIFLAGLGLIGYSFYFIGIPLIQGRTGNPIAVLNYSTYIVQVVVSSHGTVLYALVIGIGMILGSLIGMRDAWANILK